MTTAWKDTCGACSKEGMPRLDAQASMRPRHCDLLDQVNERPDGHGLLVEEIVCAQLLGLGPGLLVSVVGQHDDRERTAVAGEVLQHSHAVHPGHVEVAQQQGGRARHDLPYRLL